MALTTRTQNLTTAEGGFSLIELLIVVAVIGILAALAVPNLMAARRSANEASAISTIRTIMSAQGTYQATYGNNIDFAASGPDLAANFLLDNVVGAAAPATKSGYLFTITGSPSSGGAASTFDVIAEPERYGSTGDRSFYANESGLIFYVNGSTAGNRTSPGTPLQ